jgi:hypothetical protein
MEENINYVTYFDKNFLVQGITLVQNLKRKSSFNKIIVVALDDNTETVLNDLNFSYLKVINIEKIFKSKDFTFNSNLSKREFIWTLTPIIIQYVLNSFNSEYLIYLDADMYLLKSDSKIIENFKISKKSAYITPHFYSPVQDQTSSSGKFCVQYLIFYVSSSHDIVDQWVEDCLNDCSESHSSNGMGDQKYLTFWDKKYKNRIYIENDNGLFLAPWNINHYRYSDAIFFHFQGLRIIKNKYCLLIQSFEINQVVKRNCYSKYLGDIKNSIVLLNKLESYIKQKISVIDYFKIIKFQILFSIKSLTKKILNNFPIIVKKI